MSSRSTNSICSSTSETARRQAAVNRLKANQLRSAAERNTKIAKNKAELVKQEADNEEQTAEERAQLLEREAELLDEEQDMQSGHVGSGPSSQHQQAPHFYSAATPSVVTLDDFDEDHTRPWVDETKSRSVPMRVDPWLQDKDPETRAVQSVAPCALPRLSLDKFDGDPLEWPRWSALFHKLVHLCPGLSDAERMAHLQSCLNGPAQEAISGYLCDGNHYDSAVRELRRQFGDPSHVVRASLGRLLATPTVKPNDFASLSTLSCILHSTVGVLTFMGYKADLAATANLRQVLVKLPDSVVWRWGEHAVYIQPAIPTLSDLDKWLRSYVDAGRAAGAMDRQDRQQMRTPNLSYKEASRRAAFALTSQVDHAPTTSVNVCVKCGDCHAVSNCPDFIAADVNARAQIVREHRLCWICLTEGHVARNCHYKMRCNASPLCNEFHHVLLHGAARIFPPRAGPVQDLSDSERGNHVGTVASSNNSVVLLQILPVVVSGRKGKRTVNAMLDLGSQVSLITERLAAEIGVEGPTKNLCLGTIDGRSTYKSQQVHLTVQPLNSDDKFVIHSAHTTPRLNVSGFPVKWSTEKQKWPHLADLNLQEITSRSVELLIGADQVHLIMPLAVRRGSAGAPWAVKTRLGWVVSGRIPEHFLDDCNTQAVNCISMTRDSGLHEQVSQWWDTESFGTKYHVTHRRSKQDKLALQILGDTTKRAGDRYITGLIWATPTVKLPCNYSNALSRLKSTEKRLDRDPDLARSYNATIDEYVREGYARKLLPSELAVHSEREWYLPHHGVSSPHKPGKVRVVFDAAARSGGTCLNDHLLTGPDLTNSLVGVLMKFRQRPVALSADIRAMFHQVRVIAEDLPSLRFLWRGADRNRRPDVYNMEVLVFGSASSACSATYVLQKCAHDHQSQYPSAATAVRSRFYVDDYLDSLENEQEAIIMQNYLTRMLKTGGFHLTKWSSSSPVVLKGVAVEDRSVTKRDLDLGGSECERALGIIWDAVADMLTFKATDRMRTATKRGILGTVSAVFDPLGLLAPWTLRAKCLLQAIWRAGYGWDDIITDDSLAAAWRLWVTELPKLVEFKVSRCYRMHDSVPVNCQLHIFADASEMAFGSVAYFRFEFGNGDITTSFVISKTRVAPLRQLSVPRLELQAAVMAVRVAELIRREHDIPVDSCHFWSDSKTVLQWIRSESRQYHTFVANRIAEIQDESDVKSWAFCPGMLNPADICSRGCRLPELLADPSWLHGPKFLGQPIDEWPASMWSADDSHELDAAEIERRPTVHVGATTEERACVIRPERYSSWTRLLRVISWILRFGRNCRVLRQRRDTGPLSSGEIKGAEIVCARLAQSDAFPAEQTALKTGKQLPHGSRLIPLRPFMDKSGVIRVGGRLNRLPTLTFAARHQVILPSRHDVTRLVVMDQHRRLAHAGTEHVLSQVRQSFWVLRGRAAVRAYTFSCMLCKRRRVMPRPPVMAPLPEVRMAAHRPPFSCMALDYLGPVTVTIYRRSEKRYGCLFTCLTTRAVHLEVARSLDTSSLIMCLRRMIARRGQPQYIYSDNGTNMRGAERELREALQELDQAKITDTLSQDGTEWRFIPPNSPHFGGAWERLIQSTKRALRAVVGQQRLTDETLQTFLAEVEAILNSRPLTHISSDPADLEPLTPNHLLLGRASPNLPPGVFAEADLSSRKRWRHGQRLADEFWRRWRREYLPDLTVRRKWKTEGADLRTGDLVLIADDKTPRGMWTMGRIVRPISSADGRVRTAIVKTATGEYTRPAAKLCILEEDQA